MFICKFKNIVINNLASCVLIAILGISFFIFFQKVAILNIIGSSMYPTYDNKDVVVLRKERKVSRDNIIVFKSPNTWQTSELILVKRIVATKGDTVTINKNNVFINDLPLYHNKNACKNVNEKTLLIEDEKFLVMGDNVQNSNDSITEYCLGNSDFLIDENSILTQGKEILTMKGW